MTATRVFAVDLVCYLCGYARAVEVDRLEQVRPTGCPLEHCGGRLFVSAATPRYTYLVDPGSIDWNEGLRKAGRPRKQHVEGAHV